MYLKQVEMRGFKSFADKTIVEFREGVTCVVGPNGSGKSNITDAVRWVLGEQRVKTLRGNKMEDVIFSGTKHRKSLGLAEVKLTFDNSDHFFPLEYEEISIVRRVHRSGESEYLINQMPCRLKDVRELFMDTGIGREGYSIIGQGRIDEILSNNKEERRLLFEEAAGIIKYKTRKVDSERKLKTTSENLLRIQDIIGEIEDRVEPLRLESERAKQYIELTDALKNIELNYYAKRYQEIEVGMLEAIEQLRSYEDELKAIELRQSDLKVMYQSKDSQMYSINRDIRALEAQFHELNNYESKTVGERDLLHEKKSNTHLNIKRIEDELAEIEDQKNITLRNIELLNDERDAINMQWQECHDVMAKVQLSIQEHQFLLDQTISKNDKDRRDVIDQLNLVEIKKQEIETLKRMTESLADKIKLLELQLSEQNQLIEQSHHDRSAITSKLEQAYVQQNEVNLHLSKAIQFGEFNQKQLSETIKTYEKVTTELSKATTEHSVLKTLEDEYDGYDKGVKDILVSLEDQTGIIGIVASLIEVPQKYETAIEVALGRSIQNIVCEKISDAKRSIDFLRKNDLGRVTFLPLENLDEKGQQAEQMSQATKEKGFIGVAKDLIKIDDRYKAIAEFLLGRILIVEDFDTASRMIKIRSLKYKVITLQGDVLVPGGAISGGSFKSKVSNILSRKRRITELSDFMDKQHISKHQLEQELEQLKITLKDHEEGLKQLRFEQDALKLDIVKLEHMRDNHDQAVDSTKELMSKYATDLSTLKTEYDSSLQQIENNSIIIKETEASVLKVESALTDVKSEIESIELSLKQDQENFMSHQIKAASLEQMKGFKERESARIADDLELMNQKIAMRQKQIIDFKDHTDIFDEQIETLSSKILQIKRDVEACKLDIEAKSKVKQREYGEIEVITQELASLSTRHDSAKENAHKIDVKKVKFEVEKDTLTAELWEKYEMSIAEVLQVEETPYQKSEMKQLRYELKLLGTVNVNAIKEYEDVSTRYSFLSEQKKDLTDAVSQLEKIILDLEKKMIIMFKENFDVINEHFKSTFKALFNGGDAELLLADYDDILDCDIEIIAQPPGKKLQNINLLSGGEKALTAIALLFAILSTKPTPFCILDEIEAALDDVNVYRFAEFIKDYAKHSQFVVITHRKGTMEIADTLYGVTMEEYGISKVLSVKLEEIAAQLD